MPIPLPLEEALWLGKRGPLTETGLTQMLWRSQSRRGSARSTPNQFRHTFAHTWLARGGSEGDLVQLTGWTGRDMLARGVHGRRACTTSAPPPEPRRPRVVTVIAAGRAEP